MAIASTCRGVAGDTPFTSQLFLSAVVLVQSSAIIARMKWRQGTEFRLPWYTIQEIIGSEIEAKYVFNCKLFACVLLLTICNYAIGSTVQLGNNAALESNIN